jgi:hypothetical protein
VADLRPQIESAAKGGLADLREVAQVIAIPVSAEDGGYRLRVLRGDSGDVTAVRVDFVPDALN